MLRSTAKCGMDCGTCPWGPYTRQDMTAEEFEKYKKRAKEILGYTPMKTPCPTCQTPDKEIPKGSKLPPRNCLIRQCVSNMHIENCAYCSRFPCEHAKDTGGAWNRRKLEEKLGAPISDADHHAYVEPFEALTRLESVRASLKPEEIVEAVKASPTKIEIMEFPEKLPFMREEIVAFKAVHKLLADIKRSTLGLEDTDVFAQQQRLKARRPHFLRFIWILGRFCNLKKKGDAHLIVDSKTYIDNRGSETTLASWSFVQSVILKILPEFGVHAERVALAGMKERDLATPGGYLRSKGWVMTMTLDEKVGGDSTLKALQTYAKKLDEKYGKKAFGYFANVDMQVLV